jgi:hypothetical protein
MAKLGLPVKSPAKPVKTSVPEAVPVTVTAVPSSIVAEQLELHAAAAPPKSTEPPPSPANVTLTVCCCTNVAVTVASASSENVQAAPVQALLQASKRDPELAAGVSVTGVPSGSCTEQVPLVVPFWVAEQEMAGVVFDEMLPDPLPCAVTVSVCSLTTGVSQTFAVPFAAHDCGDVHVPQLATERVAPQLSFAATAPQFFPSRAQNAESVSGVQLAPPPLQPEAAQMSATATSASPSFLTSFLSDVRRRGDAEHEDAGRARATAWSVCATSPSNFQK